MATWTEWLRNNADWLIPAAGTAAGTAIAATSASRASNQQQEANQAATALQRDIFNQQQANLAPYQSVGTNALNALAFGVGLSGYQGGGGQAGTGQNALSGSLGFPFGAQNPDAGGNFLSRVGTGAGLGALGGAQLGMIGGPIGAAGGALIGAGASLFGRGRREADQIVPYQNALTQESARVGELIRSGQVSETEAAAHMNSLIGQFNQMAEGFGRAGPGAVRSIQQHVQPVVDQWAASQPASPAGTNAMAQGAAPSGVGFGEFNQPFNFETAPGYEFRLGEGQKAIERSAAARGSLLSGATMKALARYSQEYASNEFNNAFNRFQIDRDAKFNRFASLAGIGQTATSQVNNAAANFGAFGGQNLINTGNAAAAGSIGVGNAINQGIGQGITGAVGAWQDRNLLNYLRRQETTIPQAGPR